MKGFVRLIECRQMAKHGYQSLSGVKGNILAIAVMSFALLATSMYDEIGRREGRMGAAA